MSGFLVVYAVDLQIHFVVDVDWVLDFDYEKSIKSSLNHTQIHCAFYSSNPDSRNEEGEIKHGYKPKLELPIARAKHFARGFDFEKNWEGVIRCQQVHFFRKFIILCIKCLYFLCEIDEV